MCIPTVADAFLFLFCCLLHLMNKIMSVFTCVFRCKNLITNIRIFRKKSMLKINTYIVLAQKFVFVQ